MLRVRVFDDWLRLPLGLEDLLRFQLLTLLRHALQLLQVLVVVSLDSFEEYIGLCCFDESVYVLYTRLRRSVRVLDGGLVQEIFDVLHLAARLRRLHLVDLFT